jgi:hypothetical protein
LAVLNLDQLDLDTPAWYAFVMSAPAADWAAFVRRSLRLLTAGRRGGVLAAFRNDTLDTVQQDRKTLRFDGRFDIVI